MYTHQRTPLHHGVCPLSGGETLCGCVLVSGRLTKADRELIVVATSMHNKCLYCVVSHSALHRIYSKKPTVADQVQTPPLYLGRSSDQT